MISTATHTRAMTPLGPFSLANQNRYFGGWLTPAHDGGTILMAFPVEGWQHSAAVALRQEPDGTIAGTVAGPGDPDAAWQQALTVLSLDVDGTGYPDIGRTDPVIAALQRTHAYLRPVLFHSPYEAACAFVIAHRLSMARGRAIRQRMAAGYGTALTVAGTEVHAFPAPRQLLQLDAVPGLTGEKVQRLHGVARAALDGTLDRAHLRRLPLAQALAQARSLRGIGEFFAAGIVLRGAGVVDAVPDEDITRAGIQRLYRLPASSGLDRITDGWRPYRMWCSVLTHVDERRHRAAS
ncbi:MAG TPA: hypothetical protein VJT31_20475 [Rugosimonospora sp.]|nr:hypothetical protein [Rugosimonospora sp.]